jgi:hypothetical protein
MAQFLEQIAHEQRYDERVKLAAIYARDNSTELVSSTITELLAHPPEEPVTLDADADDFAEIITGGRIGRHQSTHRLGLEMARVAGMTDQLHQEFTGPDQQFNKLTVGKLMRDTADEPALQLMQQSPPATRKLLISEAIRRRRTSLVEAMFTWLLAHETLQTAERYLHGCSSDFVAMRLATGEHWQSEQVAWTKIMEFHTAVVLALFETELKQAETVTENTWREVWQRLGGFSLSHGWAHEQLLAILLQRGHAAERFLQLATTYPISGRLVYDEYYNAIKHECSRKRLPHFLDDLVETTAHSLSAHACILYNKARLVEMIAPSDLYAHFSKVCPKALEEWCLCSFCSHCTSSEQLVMPLLQCNTIPWSLVLKLSQHAIQTLPHNQRDSSVPFNTELSSWKLLTTVAHSVSRKPPSWKPLVNQICKFVIEQGQQIVDHYMQKNRKDRFRCENSDFAADLTAESPLFGSIFRNERRTVLSVIPCGPIDEQ